MPEKAMKALAEYAKKRAAAKKAGKPIKVTRLEQKLGMK